MNWIIRVLVLVVLWNIGFASEVKYKLYCMYTPIYEEFFKAVFLPSIKDNFSLEVYSYPQDCPSGEFYTPGWSKTTSNKLLMLKEAIIDNWGGIFFYSDIDIAFMQPILEHSLHYLGLNDFVVQQEWPYKQLCSGFFVMRGNKRTLKLIEKAYYLQSQGYCSDDQTAIQMALKDRLFKGIQWQFLPIEQYPNGQYLLNPQGRESQLYSKGSVVTVNSSMLLFHANWCVGLEQKQDFLERAQKMYLDMR